MYLPQIHDVFSHSFLDLNYVPAIAFLLSQPHTVPEIVLSDKERYIGHSDTFVMPCSHAYVSMILPNACSEYFFVGMCIHYMQKVREQSFIN